MQIKFSARADTLDFRDRVFQPSLIEVPPRWDLENYRRQNVPILNQGKTWACTGFALSTVVHYLHRRRDASDTVRVSPCMLYEMARRYDEYPGERYNGSSARGAMKGWHHHGVCRDSLWPFKRGRPDRRLTKERAADARSRPLGSYLRVNHTDLVAMHCALAEVGVLFAVANVHTGWLKAGKDGIIRRHPASLGGHAIVIVAWDEYGFWLQNSWGEGWGRGGFARIDYDDWLDNGLDAWVARLGVPVRIQKSHSSGPALADVSHAPTHHVDPLRPHFIRIHREGYLRSNDRFGTSQEDLNMIFDDSIPQITSGWKKRRMIVSAGSGLANIEQESRVLARQQQIALGLGVYPLAFLWRSDFEQTITEVLQSALTHRRSKGVGGSADFMMERMDASLDYLAREHGGKLHWDEMKRTAMQASLMAEGGARLLAGQLKKLKRRDPSFEIHLLGHGAGAILLAPLVQVLTTRGRITSGPMRGRRGHGLTIESCSLWAPACTAKLFHSTFYWAIASRAIRRFQLFTLQDRAEREDSVGRLYQKSLLFLISNALEGDPRDPFGGDGVSIVGMERHVRNYPELLALFKRRTVHWILTPNLIGRGAIGRSLARRHGDFQLDIPTLLSTISFVLGEDVTRKRQFQSLTEIAREMPVPQSS